MDHHFSTFLLLLNSFINNLLFYLALLKTNCVLFQMKMVVEQWTLMKWAWVLLTAQQWLGKATFKQIYLFTFKLLPSTHLSRRVFWTIFLCLAEPSVIIYLTFSCWSCSDTIRGYYLTIFCPVKHTSFVRFFSVHNTKYNVLLLVTRLNKREK